MARGSVMYVVKIILVGVSLVLISYILATVWAKLW